MFGLTLKLSSKALLRIAALAATGVALSGCTYDLGLGFASDGYGNSYYECDPYSAFDSYYDCDNGHGFSNIGYGGGWYQDYWYPGHGFFLFDSYGRRHNMYNNHRRYWGERRHRWYHENRGHDGRRGDNRGRDYTDNSGLDTIGWPERGGGRARDNDRNGRGRDGDGRRDRNRGWQGGEGEGANAIPTPSPNTVRGRGDGRRGEGRQRWRGNDQSDAVQTPRPDGRSEGRNGGYRQSEPSAANTAQPTARPVATPKPDRPRADPPLRQSRSGSVRVPEQ